MTVHEKAYIKNFSFTLPSDVQEDLPAAQKKKLAVSKNLERAITYIPGVGLADGLAFFIGMAAAEKKAPGAFKKLAETAEGKAFIARTVLNMVGLGPILALLDAIGTIMKENLNKPEHRQAFIKAFGFTSAKDVGGKKEATDRNISRVVESMTGEGLATGIKFIKGVAEQEKVAPGTFKDLTKTPEGKARVARTFLNMFLGPVVLALDGIATAMRKADEKAQQA